MPPWYRFLPIVPSAFLKKYILYSKGTVLRWVRRSSDRVRRGSDRVRRSSYRVSSVRLVKVHKIENFFGSEFEFYTISLLVMLKY
jgi:hypothetical protein